MMIEWVNFTPWASLAGGALIGLSAALFILFNGRVAGISGILGGLLRPLKGDVSWRLAFGPRVSQHMPCPDPYFSTLVGAAFFLTARPDAATGDTSLVAIELAGGIPYTEAPTAQGRDCRKSQRGVECVVRCRR